MRSRTASGFSFILSKTIATMIIVCCLAEFSRGQCERWVPTNGPSGGHVLSLAIDPLSPATLYAGTDQDGLFRSTNRGDDWTAVNGLLAGQRVTSVVIDPAAPSVVYAGTHAGVFRSTDRGDHWTAVNTGAK